jgi:Zn-dependent metalloprotease
MKNLLPLCLALCCTFALSAQDSPKKTPKLGPVPDGQQIRFRRPDAPALPLADPGFGLPTGQTRRALPALQPLSAPTPALRVARADNGLPIAFWGETSASGEQLDARAAEAGALAYLASLKPAGLQNPADEFSTGRSSTDAQGNTHVRLQQQIQGIPVHGGELIAHCIGGRFQMLNGRYYPTPELPTLSPALSAGQAIQRVQEDIGLDKVKQNWRPDELQLIGGTPFKAELVVYHPKRDLKAERLAWQVVARPNLLSRLVYFVDASDGTVLHHFDHTCNFVGHRHRCDAPGHTEAHEAAESPAAEMPENAPPPPATGTGNDLLGQPRSFGVWQVSSNQFLLEDASLAMFNSAASNMPNDPVGAVVTLTALNTSPQNQASFNYSFVSSTTSSFTSPTAVSGHWNSIKSYQYFKNNHGRSSIDGVGGNIIAFVNVAEDDGSSMENAFWNGDAMWYGNGGSSFRPLARGLDVGGHEMTHGVIEKTANLEYQDESGALNESFADVFAAMIDSTDWKIGEDVMQNVPGLPLALRDLQDPHNGVSSNSPWWQPKHTNEQYTGNQDNGGVHINSGIPNHAFYLFTTNAAVGKQRAERVYYKALNDYLVKSSQFVDMRIAVVQAATDLYGATVANAAASAFAAVGIGDNGGQPGGNYLGDLAVNPGGDLILCVSNNKQTLSLAEPNGVVFGNIYTNGVASRPSITDNGSQVVFVNPQGHIIPIDLVYNGAQITPTVNPPYSEDPIWRNAAISKDGRFLAAITDFDDDNRIFIVDLGSAFGDTYEYTLYNPTYSQQPVATDGVRYADVLEFDYSGEYLMYDAFNALSNGQNDISYWDIGFLRFRENGNFITGTPPISKLFTGLPENTGVGNPTFAKNSPYIIAFDFFENDGSQYDIYGVNVETGDYNILVSDNGDLGWPNYNRQDNAIIFQSPDFSSVDIYRQGIAADKISPQGNTPQFIANREWGVWYADGNRSLQVGTADPAAAALRLQCWPNPVHEKLQIRLESAFGGKALLSVSGLLGETLLSQTQQLQPGDNQFELNLLHLPAGTYLLQLATDKTLATTKFIKN